MKSKDAATRVGKLVLSSKESGFVCIEPNQEYTVKHGLFGKKEKKVYDDIGWVNKPDTPVSWGVVDPYDNLHLKRDQLKIAGKVYDIRWLNEPEAKEVYAEYFDRQSIE